MKGFLTIDIGTSNWKAMIFRTDGSVACSAKHPTTTVTGPGGLSYYDPHMIWDTLVHMIQTLSAQFSFEDLAAVCVTSMGESVVPIGHDGTPLFPIIPWFDTRSIGEAAEIRDRIGEKRIFSLTGAEAGAIFSLPKMLWMRGNFPEIYSGAVKWLQMTDYINYMLSGKFVTDYSMACRTLAFDMERNVWSREILDAFEVDPSLFPDVIKSGEIIGTVTKAAAELMGLPFDLPVVMGGHDHPVATLAGCTFGSDMVFDSSGTAEPYLYVSQKNAPLPEKIIGQRIARHPDPSRYIVWGGIVSSGVTVDWSVKRLALCSDWGEAVTDRRYDELFKMAQSLSPGSEGIIFHPHLRGSGAPNWDPRFKGAFLGLTSNHTSVHMLRAVLEGLCYQARMLIEMHEEISSNKISLIRCMGGGSRISLWQQIKADVTGCTVETGMVDEATPLGAAMLCSVGIGSYSSLEEAARALQPAYQTYRPDPERHALYSEYFALYKESYDALTEVNHKLDALTRGK